LAVADYRAHAPLTTWLQTGQCSNSQHHTCNHRRGGGALYSPTFHSRSRTSTVYDTSSGLALKDASGSCRSRWRCGCPTTLAARGGPPACTRYLRRNLSANAN